MIDHPLGRGESGPSRLRVLVGTRAIAPPLVLLGLVVVSALARALLAREIPNPFIFGDELLHGELARSVREHGRYLVRGHHVTISFLYPAAIAPAWLASSTETVYTVAKTLNAVLMSLAAVPVYLWGRRFLSARGALAAAALTLLLPGLVLTGTLMTENAFFPAFLLALFAISACVERPTLAHQSLAVAAIALAGAARLQGLLLVAVLPAAVVAERVLARRAREIPGALARLWPVGVLVVAAVVAYVAAKGGHVGALGVYSGVAPTHYSVWGVARWAAYALGELALATAVAPLAALLLLLALPARNAGERAFLATAAAALGALVVLAGFAAFWAPHGLKDRYMLPGIPALFLALVLWVERGLPRPRAATAVAVLVPLALVAVLPLGELFSSPALLGNALGLVPFHRVAGAFGGNDGLKAGIVLGAAILAGIFALVPRRVAPAALAVPLVALLVLSSASLFRAVRAQARAVEALAALPTQQWIDPHAREAAYLNATQYEPESARGEWFSQWVPVWESEFFNRSLGGTIGLGLREPLPVHQVDASLDWATGRIDAPAPPALVVDPRFVPAGRRLARTTWLDLYAVRPPLRLVSAVESVYRDGWSGNRAVYDRWGPAGDSVLVTVSREGSPQSGDVTVTSGPLASQGGGAVLGGETAQQVVAVPSGETRTVRIPVPAAPYRVEVAVPDTFTAGRRELGARVTFRAAPA